VVARAEDIAADFERRVSAQQMDEDTLEPDNKPTMKGSLGSKLSLTQRQLLKHVLLTK